MHHSRFYGRVRTRTRYEFRVKQDPKFFRKYDRKYEMKGEVIEIVSLFDDDPRFDRFVKVYTKYKKEKPRFFAYVRLDREYSEEELAAAGVLTPLIHCNIEPSGEECGTAYDDTDECTEPLEVGHGVRCGSGRRLSSALVLDLSKIPSVDIASTIAYGEEWVVSGKFKETVLRNDIDGCEFVPVEDVKGRESFRDKWFQLVVNREVGISTPPSFFADDPFTRTNRHRCSMCGRLKGLRLWTELYIEPDQFTGDIAKTRQLYGYRKGVLMPMPLIVISQRFYRVLREEKIRGFHVEIAHEA